MYANAARPSLSTSTLLVKAGSLNLNHFTSRLLRSPFAQFRCQDKSMAKNMFEKGQTLDLLFIWAEDSLHFQPSFQQEYQVGPVSTNIELKD